MLAEKQFVRRMVGIAQLVEHLVVVQDVAGSSPVTHPSGNPLWLGEMVGAGFLVQHSCNKGLV